MKAYRRLTGRDWELARIEVHPAGLVVVEERFITRPLQVPFFCLTCVRWYTRLAPCECRRWAS